MRQKLRICALLLGVLILASGCAPTTGVQEERQIATLTAIDITDNTLNINADKPFKYTIYKPSDPYKAIVELPDVKLGIAAGKIKSEKAGITEVIPSQTDEPPLTKLEILLSSPAGIVPGYKDTLLTLNIINLEEELKAKTTEKAAETPKTEETNIAAEKIEDAFKETKTVEIAKPEEKPKTAQKEEPALPKAAAPKALPPATSIVKVNIEKEQDVLKLTIKGNGSLNPNVFELDNRTVLDMPNVTLEAPLPKAQAPLKGIRSGKYKDKTRIVLDLKEKTSFTVTSIEDSVIVAFQLPEKETYAAKAEKPASVETKTEGATPEKPSPKANEEGKYKGQIISLTFQDADIVPILRDLVTFQGKSSVIDPSLKGKRINLQLDHVPVDQAMDIILQTHNLAKQEEGNVVWIAPIDTFTKMSKEKTAAKDVEEKATAALSPLERKTYRLMHANVETVKNQLLGVKLTSTEDKITKERTVTTIYDEKQKILSPRGTATSDRASNVLVVTDIPTKIAQVNDFIKEIDQPIMQVMIEAKIASVSSDYSEALGIRWGGTIGTPPAGIGIGEIKSGTFSVNTPIATGGSAAAITGGVLGLSLGSASTVQVNLSLSALESVNKAKTISNPKILTLDTLPATITSGRTIYGRVPDEQGVPKLQKVDATLSLTVTPLIKRAPDGYYVLLDVKVKDDSLVSADPLVINTKSINTNALVKDGDTLVLGGIYTTEIAESEAGIPLLSKIPIFGWLFKTKTQTGPNVKEMLIFITPRVVTKP